MMNERTEQLYKEAVNSASAELHEWNKNWRWGNHTNFDYEKVLYKKFAELMVKKFDDILVLEYLDCVGNEDKPAAERVERLREKVKTYFGVEE